MPSRVPGIGLTSGQQSKAVAMRSYPNLTCDQTAASESKSRPTRESRHNRDECWLQEAGVRLLADISWPDISTRAGGTESARRIAFNS